MATVLHNKAVFSVGIGGNYYVTSDDANAVAAICELIGKSKESVYFNKKYNVWAIRIKSSHHKKKIKEVLYDYV